MVLLVSLIKIGKLCHGVSIMNNTDLLQGIAEQTVSTLGKVIIYLKIGEEELEHVFHIVSNDFPCSGGIIGADFLQLEDLTVQICPGKVLCINETCLNFRKLRKDESVDYKSLQNRKEVTTVHKKIVKRTVITKKFVGDAITMNPAIFSEEKIIKEEFHNDPQKNNQKMLMAIGESFHLEPNQNPAIHEDCSQHSSIQSRGTEKEIIEKSHSANFLPKNWSRFREEIIDLSKMGTDVIKGQSNELFELRCIQDRIMGCKMQNERIIEGPLSLFDTFKTWEKLKSDRRLRFIESVLRKHNKVKQEGMQQLTNIYSHQKTKMTEVEVMLLKINSKEDSIEDTNSMEHSIRQRYREGIVRLIMEPNLLQNCGRVEGLNENLISDWSGESEPDDAHSTIILELSGELVIIPITLHKELEKHSQRTCYTNGKSRVYIISQTEGIRNLCELVLDREFLQ